jgi:hypothetical protein
MRILQRLSTIFRRPPHDPEPGDVVLLGNPGSEAEAELWRNILAQWGIAALVRNRSATAYLHLGDDFEVFVRRDDLDEARQLVGLEPPPPDDPREDT